MAQAPPASKAAGLEPSADQPDLDGDWTGSELEPATTVADPARQYLTFALLLIVAIVIVTLLGLVGAHRISTGDATQLGGLVLSPLFTLLGLAVAYYFRHGRS